MSDGKSESLPRLLSVAEAAALLGVSGPKVRTLIREGRLPAVQLGKSSTRVRECDVVALVRGGVR